MVTGEGSVLVLDKSPVPATEEVSSLETKKGSVLVTRKKAFCSNDEGKLCPSE